MTTFVIDANVVIKWVVEERGAPEALLLRRHRLLAPERLIAECANIFRKKVRQQEMLAQEAVVNAGLLARPNIAFEPMAGLFEAATRLAVSLDHPACDCGYLALSAFRGCDFVTADESRKIRSASLPFKVLVLRDTGPA